jgi:hypothetical protein
MAHGFPDRRFVRVDDGGYATHDLARSCHRRRATPGRAARRGGRLVRYGRGLIPVRWAFVRDATGTHRDEYFVTTDPAMTPVAVVSLYTARWPIETTFQEAREHLGLESLPQRSARSVLRTAACLLGLYTVVALPFADHVRRRPRPVARQASADVRRRPGHGPPAGVTAELIGDPEREVGSRQKATGHAAVRAGPPRPSGVAAREVQKSSLYGSGSIGALVPDRRMHIRGFLRRSRCARL